MSNDNLSNLFNLLSQNDGEHDPGPTPPSSTIPGPAAPPTLPQHHSNLRNLPLHPDPPPPTQPPTPPTLAPFRYLQNPNNPFEKLGLLREPQLVASQAPVDPPQLAPSTLAPNASANEQAASSSESPRRRMTREEVTQALQMALEAARKEQEVMPRMMEGNEKIRVLNVELKFREATRPQGSEELREREKEERMRVAAEEADEPNQKRKRELGLTPEECPWELIQKMDEETKNEKMKMMVFQRLRSMGIQVETALMEHVAVEMRTARWPHPPILAPGTILPIVSPFGEPEGFYMERSYRNCIACAPYHLEQLRLRLMQVKQEHSGESGFVDGGQSSEPAGNFSNDSEDRTQEEAVEDHEAHGHVNNEEEIKLELSDDL